MIQIQNVTKYFDDIQALDRLTLDIRDGEIFGLVGTNGAGKSTLLRIMAGIYRPDEGNVSIGNKTVYENEAVKAELYYISDEAWFLSNATPMECGTYMQCVYPGFRIDRFRELLQTFHLEERRRIQTFSKGMKRQLSFLLGLCAGTKYLLCDETFDGLDPVMRQAVKSIIAQEVLERDFTPVIASHNLRELEDICERVGLMHRGGILFARDLEDMKQKIHRIQCVIPDEKEEKALLSDLDVLHSRHQGTLLMLTARGNREDIIRRVGMADPVFSEVLPLSLEEIFIDETEVAGYEIKNILE